MKMYGCKAIEGLFSRYYELGGEVIELIPGTLGHGLTVCFGDGLKTAVIKEQYINCWSSGHTVRFYNGMPEKYRKMIENYISAEVA